MVIIRQLAAGMALGQAQAWKYLQPGTRVATIMKGQWLTFTELFTILSAYITSLKLKTTLCGGYYCYST